MANKNLHETHFWLWWFIQTPNGMLERQERKFGYKDEAHQFLMKQPHIVHHGAGCYMETKSIDTARDGKQIRKTVQEDMWTQDEMCRIAKAGKS